MTTLLTTDVVRFLAVVTVAAAWLVLHVDLLRRTLGATLLSPLQRALCIVPPITTYYAYRLGARRKAVMSVLLFVVYLALRTER